MPPRDPALYLADIVEAARAIDGFLAGRSLDDFIGDDLLASAVHSKLIIVGEAAATFLSRPEMRSSTWTGERSSGSGTSLSMPTSS